MSHKLVLYIVAATCALLITTVSVGYDSGGARSNSKPTPKPFKQVQATALTMDSYVDRVAVLVRAIASRQEAIGVDPDALRLLLIEDNEVNRDMLTSRLERRGYAVLTAGDGAEGLAMAEAELPDLILMDMSLPVMDGWEATRAIKASHRTSAIPVIALTALAMAGDREQALAAGCNDYDTKPIKLSRLPSKIETLLTRASEPKA